MNNTSLDLSNKLPAEQVSVIRQVVRTAERQRLPLFIVGAQARDLLLQYVYDLKVHRATNDIDFGTGDYFDLVDEEFDCEKASARILGRDFAVGS